MPVEDIKKVSLGNYPTPIEKMENLTKKLGYGKLYIKRDDLTGPALGGNKTRKLEYLMQDAIEKGCTTILTEGGTQTNHGRTTVGASVKLGLKSILVLKGSDTGYLSGNLTLDTLMGSDIYFVEDGDLMKEKIKEVVKKHESMGEKVYTIPMGGSSNLGAVGYIMAVKEIMEQIEKEDIQIDHIVCTVGSLGTYIGLLLGIKYFKAPFNVIGIPVIPKDEEANIDEALEYGQKVIDEFDLGITITKDDINIIFGSKDLPYTGEAYNKPDALTREYITMLAKTEAIILDPTYTGKTFRGFVDLVKEGNLIPHGNSAMFIHTGGVVALWTHEHLEDMQSQLRSLSNIKNI